MEKSEISKSGVMMTMVRKLELASFDYEVDNYSARKRIGVGEAIESHQFVIGGHRWAILLYPEGLNDVAHDEGYLSLCISMMSESVDPVQFLFDLCMRNQSGVGNDCRKFSSLYSKQVKSWNRESRPIGNHYFIRRASLDSRFSTYVRNDTLRIGVTVGVFTYYHHHHHHLSDEHVFFKVAEETFWAEKSVLATRCPALLSRVVGDGCQLDDVVIPDVEPEVFSDVLWFVYKGSLQQMVEKALDDKVPCILESFEVKLLAAADKFELDELKKICELSISKKVSRESVVNLLQLAYVCRAAHLKSACLRFAAKNKSVIMESDEYEHLKETHPSLFLDLAGSWDNYSQKGWDGRRWANHECAIWLWMYVGIVCGVCSLVFLDVNNINKSCATQIACIIISLALYFGGYKLVRDSEFLHNVHLYELPWYFSVVVNGCAAAIALWVEVSHENSHDAVSGFMVVAIAVMALVEIVKPVTDYGFLQFFLRMPLQISILQYGVGLHMNMILPALLFIFGTVWVPWSKSYNPTTMEEPPPSPPE